MGACRRTEARILGTALLALIWCVPGEATAGRQFLWMYGLRGPGSVEAAQTVGLNTLYLPTTTAVDSVEDNRRLARAAHAAGLQVIICLPVYSREHAADPYDEGYRGEIGPRLRAVVRQFLEEPGVSGWATGEYPERELRVTPAGFQAFVQRRYGTLEVLNQAWRTSFPTWAQINLTAAREADASQPWGVGRASVDAADFQAEALRDLLRFWAEQVRELDAERPLFTGRLAVYRSLVSVPEEYSYVVPEMPVEVVERDYTTQNVHAVDMARQGGAFEVIPCLRLPIPPEGHYDSGRTVGRWLQEARLHGARGAALDGWERLRNNSAPESVSHTLSAHLRGVAGGFKVRPRPALCVVFTPYAEGRQAQGVPLYGYLGGLTPGQPAALAGALRLGSKYGTVDYLTPERLLHAEIDRYSAILAPTALKLPVEVQARLRAYVERGGTLVCDLGAGMYETGSWLALPGDLGMTVGVGELRELAERRGDLMLMSATPLLPGLAPPRRSQALAGADTPRTGTPAERRQTTMQGPMALARLEAGSRLLLGLATLERGAAAEAGAGAGRPAGRQPPAAAVPETRPVAGVVVNERGLGRGYFCTGTLWARWDPQDVLFQALHEAWWAPRARYALGQAGLWPQGVEMSAGEGEVHLFNVSGRAALVEVSARVRGGWLHEGAYQRLLPGAVGAGETVMWLTAEVPRDKLVSLWQRPVRVRPYAGETAVALRAYGERGIELELAGPGAHLSRSVGREWVFQGGGRVHAEVEFREGAYALPPGSWHRLRLVTSAGRETLQTVQADERGELRVEVSGPPCRLELEPVE